LLLAKTEAPLVLKEQFGVLRDLRRRDEALQLGKKAHELQPQNFRPCKLLGALNIELGNFSEGHDWYTKAEKLGASRQSIDTELKGTFRRANKTLREIMRASLFANDPDRYRWVNDKKYRSA
jgi:Flp pilus assembly protein TadD